MSRIVRASAIVLSAALALTACGSSSGGSKTSNPLSKGGAAKGTIVVGSANFPESQLLAQIYSDALKNKGLKVTNKFNIGSREVYYNQLTSGGIDVVPEYNGALLTTSVDPKSTAVTTDQVNAELKAKLPPAAALLDSSQAQDKDSVTVNTQTAQKYNLKSISDLTPVAKDIAIGGPSEFKTREQGLVGLQTRYGLHFKKFQPVNASAQSVLVDFLKNNTIQAADLFTTDPSIVVNKFVVLDDPKNVFSAQNVTPLIYKSAVDATAQAALNAVSAKLTTQDLATMLKAIVVDKGDYETVASQYLKAQGL